MGLDPYTTDEPQDSPAVRQAWRRRVADMHIRRHIAEGVMPIDDYLVRVKGHGGLDEAALAEVRTRVLGEIEAEQAVRALVASGRLTPREYMLVYLSIPEGRHAELGDRVMEVLMAGCTD